MVVVLVVSVVDEVVVVSDEVVDELVDSVLLGTVVPVEAHCWSTRTRRLPPAS